MKTLPPAFRGTWIVQVTLVLALALGAAGCRSRGGPPRPQKTAYHYIIQVHDSLADAEFQVDAVGVNASNRGLVEGSVTDYFKVPEDERPDLVGGSTMVFSPSMNRKAIDLKDSRFRKYRYPSYTHVAILANIPNPALLDQRRDRRRVLLPLDRAQWPRSWPGPKNQIIVTISREGISTDPGWLE